MDDDKLVCTLTQKGDDVILSCGQNVSAPQHIILAAPKGSVIEVIPKEHNPTEVQLTPLLSPYTGAPLEPAPQYGSSVLYDPYSQSFVAITTPEKHGAIVEPRFTSQEKTGRAMVLGYVKQAGEEIAGPRTCDFPSLMRAYNLLQQATRVRVAEQYPTSGMKRDPLYSELREETGLVGNLVDSIRETKDPAEREKYLKRGCERVHPQ